MAPSGILEVELSMILDILPRRDCKVGIEVCPTTSKARGYPVISGDPGARGCCIILSVATKTMDTSKFLKTVLSLEPITLVMALRLCD